MSEISKHRKTNSYFITLAAGFFSSTEQGIELAEDLRDAIEYWCDSYCYSVEAVIYICDRKTDGKKKCKTDDKVDPHLHIVIIANPGATVCQSIKEYLSEKVGIENCVNVQKIYDLARLLYYLDQYSFIRSTAIDTNNLPEFCAAHQKRSDVRAIIDDIDAILLKGETRLKITNKEIESYDFWGYVSKKGALTADKINILWFSLDTI